MEPFAGDSLLKQLPLVLAGPALRRTEATQVSVWVALKQACQVTLRIYDTQQAGEQVGQCILRGHCPTVAIGQHLHVAVVTAWVDEGTQPLKCDRIYAYDLVFTPQSSFDNNDLAPDTALNIPASIPLLEALSSNIETDFSISYFDHRYPTFVLPADRLENLRLAHGSCRKPSGPGSDTLPLLDSVLATTAQQPSQRLQQLFLTGDQVYGDDVADPLLWVASSLGNSLLGWREQLPINLAERHVTPEQLSPGQRDQVVKAAGFTAAKGNSDTKVTSHCLSFGEYCVLYLLERSSTCWPKDFPTGPSLGLTGKAARQWNRYREDINQFAQTLSQVRRLFANVATYTIFDDHDVSDDWNLNQSWCLRVLGQPLGYQTVQNALAAYAIFQAWGNTPAQFKPGQPGHQLLAALVRWSHSGGQDGSTEIATSLGLPTINHHTGLPTFTSEQMQGAKFWVLQRAPQALTWHYTVGSPCHEVIILDTRTRRAYPAEAKPTAPPMLLSPKAFEQQLAAPLQQSTPAKATFVIASTNAISMRILDKIQAWQLKHGKVFSGDVGDSWNLNAQALAMLLTTICKHRQSAIILSGDIHFSSAIRLDYQPTSPDPQSTILQLTSSAIRNQELLTELLHTRLKEWLLPARPRQWYGYKAPPFLSKQPHHRPTDWRCRLIWLRRLAANAAEVNQHWLGLPSTSVQPASGWDRLKFWRSRWFQSGQEMVGVNNVATLQFSLSNQPDTAEQHSQHYHITQTHYWLSPWRPIEVTASRYATALPLSSVGTSQPP